MIEGNMSMPRVGKEIKKDEIFDRDVSKEDEHLVSPEMFYVENPVTKERIKVYRVPNYHGNLQKLLTFLNIDSNDVLDNDSTKRVKPYEGCRHVDRRSDINSFGTNIQGQIVEHNTGLSNVSTLEEYFPKFGSFKGGVITKSGERFCISRATLGHTGPAFYSEDLSMEQEIDGDISVAVY